MVTGGLGDELARGMPTTVFVSDPSAEAERITQMLRARGYLVADVPLSMLVARVAVQRPRVLLVDADAADALETLAKMRELPEADAIDVVFFGKEDGAVAGVQDALARDGSGFFPRPVDVPTLLKKIEALTGGASTGSVMRPSTPPPSVSSMSLPDPPPRRPGSLPQPSMRDATASPASIPRIAPPPPSLTSMLGEERRAAAAHVSNELEQLLAEAEQRIGGQVTHESIFPTPEEEIEAVLPADVLAALDEPVDDADDDEPELGAHAKGHTSAGGGGKVTTGVGGTGVGTTGGTGGVRASAAQRPTEPPPPHRAPLVAQSGTNAGTHSGTTGARPLTDFVGHAPSIAPSNDAERPRPPSSPLMTAAAQFTSMDPAPRSVRAGEVPPAPALPNDAPRIGGATAIGVGLGPSAPMPSVLAPGDAARVVAHTIVTRATGALCIESQEGVRRVVLREGDVVTAASGLDNESLLAFLVARGDLPRDAVEHLVGKLPPFGRHAGAALVAHGHLPQDQLWSVLRAHAEWVLGRMLVQSTGTAMIEPEPPGRLRGEPSVFGGSTGAEVFVEVVRRVIAPEAALARLGGPMSRIGDGAHAALFDECALEPSIGERIQNARGNTVQSLLARSPQADVTSVLFALDLLGVVEMARALEPRAAAIPGPPPSSSADTLDEDAIRARVRARLQLVEEGDYFALLGVPRDATSYEVRRAFLELRRAFEPARILTPKIQDLSHDVRKIASVLDEAYEILRDGARRERYRRAIEGPRP